MQPSVFIPFPKSQFLIICLRDLVLPCFYHLLYLLLFMYRVQEAHSVIPTIALVLSFLSLTLVVAILQSTIGTNPETFDEWWYFFSLDE